MYCRYCTVRAGVCVYVNEVRVLNSFLENSNKERDKLKLDIQVTLHQMIENIKSKFQVTLHGKRAMSDL